MTFVRREEIILSTRKVGTTRDYLIIREKRKAMKFSHIKTFTCNPLLSDFYKSAHQELSKNIEEIERHFPENAEERQHIIKQKLADLGRILEHMDSDFVFVFQKSMKQFK